MGGMDEADKSSWLEIMEEEVNLFSANQASWKPPWQRCNAWHPPGGAVFKLMDNVKLTSALMQRCAELVVAVSGAQPAPSVGTIKAYLSRLLRRKLPYVLEGKIVAEARNAWVYVEAACIIKNFPHLFQLHSRPDPVARGGDRWIMKSDLSALKAKARKQKVELEAKSTSEHLACRRAERAEELYAIARSELDVVKERNVDLEAKLGARQAKASNEVIELRRKVKELAIREELALKRAHRAEHRLGIALSERELACKQARDASSQTNQIMEELNLQLHEMQRMMEENEQLRARASRGYTGALTQLMQEQCDELKVLRARRANNMSATKQLNLERQRVNMYKQQVDELRGAIKNNWGKDTLELAEEGAAVPLLKAQIACLQRALAHADKEIEVQRAIIYPPKPMESGSYDVKLRFTIMKLISCANVCHSRIPEVLSITSAHWGIVLPGRYRNVLVRVVDGVRHYEKHWKTWTPCANTCENIRCVAAVALAVAQCIAQIIALT